MNTLIKLIFGLTLFLCLPFAHSSEDRLIEGEYLVILEQSSVPIEQLAIDIIEASGGGEVLHVYKSVAFGFAARISSSQAAYIANLPQVTLVEQNQKVSISATQAGAVWGLDRIDQQPLPLDGNYTYPNSGGQGAHIYILDSGINNNHSEFSGRFGRSHSTIGSSSNWRDCHGHGTHVASTAAGTTWGVAKKATVHSVRVLGCDGSGSFIGIIAGMDWVALNAEMPAIANMSLGGGQSLVIDAAVERLTAAGILLVASAGNSRANACLQSPAAAPSALTVAASTRSDFQASFSNHGACVDIYAPGQAIQAADYRGGSRVLDGTSMAAPHVAGVAALIASESPALTTAQLSNIIIGTATPDAIRNPSLGTPNRLVYIDPIVISDTSAYSCRTPMFNGDDHLVAPNSDSDGYFHICWSDSSDKKSDPEPWGVTRKYCHDEVDSWDIKVNGAHYETVDGRSSRKLKIEGLPVGTHYISVTPQIDKRTENHEITHGRKVCNFQGREIRPGRTFGKYVRVNR